MNYKEAMELVERWRNDPGFTFPDDFNGWALCNPKAKGKTTIAHELVFIGKPMPPNFLQWDLRNANEWTVAHLAVVKGILLPSDFDGWHWINDTGASVAHLAAHHKYPFPENFDQWHLKNYAGATVAHVAAAAGALPEDFDRLDVATNTGWTIAHEIVSGGHALPKGFDGWCWSDKFGNTVAHLAAWLYTRQKKTNPLPDSFAKWGLVNDEGDTVAHAAANGRHPLPEHFDGWGWKNAKGIPVAHIAALKGELPESFSEWMIRNEKGETVAHILVRQERRLPKAAKAWDWSWRDQDGNTVAHEAVRNGKKLPRVFSGWGWCNAQGTSVAHLCVEHGQAFHNNPPLEVWQACDANGASVINRARKLGRLQAIAQYEERAIKDAITPRATKMPIKRSST